MLGAVLAVGAAPFGCSKTDSPGTEVATAAGSAALSASAATSAAPATPVSTSATAGPESAQRAAPVASAPELWERAYRTALAVKDAPSPPKDVSAPPLYPRCANRAGRTYLQARFGSAYEAAREEAEAQNKAAHAEYDRVVEAVNAAAGIARQKLDAALAAGLFPERVDGAAALATYGATGAKSAVAARSFDQGAEVDAFRKALASTPGWDAPFRCTVIAASRGGRPAGALHRAATKAAGKEALTEIFDMITCSPAYGIHVVVEAPVDRASAKVSVQGTEASVEAYDVAKSPGVDPEISRALAMNDAASLVGKRIEVRGVSKVTHQHHGNAAYVALTGRGMSTFAAVKSAEWNEVWIASFERACAHSGLACKADDGRESPRVMIVGGEAAPSAPTAVDSPPAAEPVREKVGMWERLARAADAALTSPGLHEMPWGNWFFPGELADAKSIASLGAVGATATIVPLRPQPTPPAIAAFREGLAREGGLKAFECTVRDMGEEVNPPRSAVLDAAQAAKQKTTAEATNWNIACEGDENSHLGTIWIWVPSSRAFATVADGKITGYELEHHGFFAPELREKLLDVGIGTKLRIEGLGRLMRSEEKDVLFGTTWSTPIWRFDMTAYQCAHAGLGCMQWDGPTSPTIGVAKGGLVTCPVSTRTYPPAADAPGAHN
jgi:hypothetical protein